MGRCADLGSSDKETGGSKLSLWAESGVEEEREDMKARESKLKVVLEIIDVDG